MEGNYLKMEGKEDFYRSGKTTSKAHSFGIISLSVFVVGIIITNTVMYYYVFNRIDQVSFCLIFIMINLQV